MINKKRKPKYCKCGYEMIYKGWYSFCSKCLKSVDEKGLHAFLIRLLIKMYRLRNDDNG